MKVSNNCSSCQDVSEKRLKIRKFTEYRVKLRPSGRRYERLLQTTH